MVRNHYVVFNNCLLIIFRVFSKLLSFVQYKWGGLISPQCQSELTHFKQGLLFSSVYPYVQLASQQKGPI